MLNDVPKVPDFPAAPTPPPPKSEAVYPRLTDGQRIAVDDMLEFVKSDEPMYLLEGFAGTGKTFCMQAFIEKFRGRVIFTAPTNKATKVLRDMMKKSDYTPECCTIYSLLGLRLEANGVVKELTTPDEVIDLSQYRVVVLDEGSMVNNLVNSFVVAAQKEFGFKLIVMADYAQIPPVGEQSSPTKAIKRKSVLTQVMRYDNQILQLATAIRQVVDHPAPTIKIAADNDGQEGVWYENARDMEAKIIDAAGEGLFSKANSAKAIAWRNVTVDHLNKIIRNRIFDHPIDPWLVGDRIIVMEPANDLEGDKIASTDDEGTITGVAPGKHPLYEDMNIWNLQVTLDDNKVITLRVLHESSTRAFMQRVDRMAAEARQNRKLWGDFWTFKEAFHKVRHGYAITAHRSQGSTYEWVFVNWRDILLNQNRQEAFRCLYVACTRAKKRLYLG